MQKWIVGAAIGLLVVGLSIPALAREPVAHTKFEPIAGVSTIDGLYSVADEFSGCYAGIVNFGVVNQKNIYPNHPWRVIAKLSLNCSDVGLSGSFGPVDYGLSLQSWHGPIIGIGGTKYQDPWTADNRTRDLATLNISCRKLNTKPEGHPTRVEATATVQTRDWSPDDDGTTYDTGEALRDQMTLVCPTT